MKKPAAPLTEADRALFRAAMAGVKPARPQRPALPGKAPSAVRPFDRLGAEDERKKTGARVEPVETRTQPPQTDARTLRKLARGRIRPEARLDLHGHTLARGHDALGRFIAGARSRGLRAVIVITGRGALDGPSLRAEVPRWLDEPDLRGTILGYSAAQPRDGGAGALYVLLRRAR